MPKTTNSTMMLFCNHRIDLQYNYLKYDTEYKTLPVENLTQFLSVSLDFLNKIILPFNLNSVTNSQEKLVDDFHNDICASDSVTDVLNASAFESSKLLLCLYEDISLESLISLCIDGSPQRAKCIYYKATSISDDYCKRVVALFYMQLIKLHNYLPVYLAFENKSLVNTFVTDIFGKHLSCIPYMTDMVALSVQGIHLITQTLTSILDVAQLLQLHDSIIGALPKDKQRMIIDNIASAPIANKVELLNQMLKNEHSNIEYSSSLLHTGKLLKEALLDSNEDEMPTSDSDSYSNSKRKTDTLNDVQDISNKKSKISSLIYISDHQYLQSVTQCNNDILDHNYAEIPAPYVLEQQQDEDIVVDSNKEVITIGTIDGNDVDYIK